MNKKKYELCHGIVQLAQAVSWHFLWTSFTCFLFHPTSSRHMDNFDPHPFPGQSQEIVYVSWFCCPTIEDSLHNLVLSAVSILVVILQDLEGRYSILLFHATPPLREAAASSSQISVPWHNPEGARIETHRSWEQDRRIQGFDIGMTFSIKNVIFNPAVGGRYLAAEKQGPGLKVRSRMKYWNEEKWKSSESFLAWENGFLKRSRADESFRSLGLVGKLRTWEIARKGKISKSGLERVQQVFWIQVARSPKSLSWHSKPILHQVQPHFAPTQEAFCRLGLNDLFRSLRNGVRKNGVCNWCPNWQCGVNTEFPCWALLAFFLITCAGYLAEAEFSRWFRRLSGVDTEFLYQVPIFETGQTLFAATVSDS